MLGSGSGAYRFCMYEFARGSSRMTVKGFSADLTFKINELDSCIEANGAAYSFEFRQEILEIILVTANRVSGCEKLL